MKSIVLFSIAIFAISFGTLSAQTNQGNILVGVTSTLSLAGTGSDIMNVGFSTVKYKSDADGYDEPDPDKMTSVNFLPSVGVFVVDNLALGLDLNIAYSSTKDTEYDNKSTQTLLSVGPYVRYYIPTSTVKPYFEVNGAYGALNSKYESEFYDDDEYKSSVVSLGGGVGMAVALGDRVTFDVLTGYSSLTVKDKEDNDDNDRTVIGTFGLKLGFTVILGSN